MKKCRTLRELDTYVKALIRKHGDTGPCAAWVITNDDLLTEDDNSDKEVILAANEAKMVLTEINSSDHDYIVDEILRVVDNELSTRGF
jgi:hypothetical protein